MTNSPMENSKVDIIIVNWNSGKMISNLLKSFERISVQGIGKVIIVDNNSSDNSVDLLESSEWSHNVQIIRNTVNDGFAKACNLGASHAESDYILFLNPDTLIYEGSIERCVEFLDQDSNKEYGACGIQLVNELNIPNRSCARIPTFQNFANSSLGLDFLFPTRFPGVLLKEWEHDSTRDIGHVIGAFYMVRKQLFQYLGGFDERFFLYYEDLDFSTVLAKQGLKVAYLSDVRAVHVGGGCSQQIKAKRLSYSYVSKVKYIRKHFGLWQSLVLISMTIFVEPIMRFAFYLVQPSVKESLISLQGYTLFLINQVGSVLRRSSRARS